MMFFKKSRSALFLALLLCFSVFLGSLGFASADVKQDLLDLINQERASEGISALEFNSAINFAAQGHSEDMLVQNYFSHTSLDGRFPWDRMNDAGFFGTAYAENIMAHTGTANASICFNAWMNSSGHYINMMNANYNFAGIGIAEGNWSYDSYNGRFSSVYTLNLGKATIACSDNQTRSCGVSDVGNCEYGTQICSGGSWGSCVGAVYPVSEICNNSLDDDCDGAVDEYCNCTSHSLTKCYNSDSYWYDSCDRREERKQDCGIYSCNNGVCNTQACSDYDRDGFYPAYCGGTDCNDSNKQINPNSTELCNNIDENCNEVIDEFCIDNLILVKPLNNSQFSTTGVYIELNVTSINGGVYMNKSGRLSLFCSSPKYCKKTAVFSDGFNSLVFSVKDYNNYQEKKQVSFFIDSKRPYILSQKPLSGSYSNGRFEISYNENYLEKINLYFSEDGINFFLADSKTDCLSGSNMKCAFDIDVSEYNGQYLWYRFIVFDKFFNATKGAYKIKIDTISPEITLNSFVKTSIFSQSYKANFTLSEKAKLTYRYSGYTGSSNLSICSSCSSIIKSFYFKTKPEYIDFIAEDNAGNKDFLRYFIP